MGMETLDFLLVTVAVEVVLVSAAMAFAIRATCSFYGHPLSLILSAVSCVSALNLADGARTLFRMCGQRGRVDAVEALNPSSMKGGARDSTKEQPQTMEMNGQRLLQKQVWIPRLLSQLCKRAALQMTGWRVLKTTRAQRSFLLKFVNHDSTPPIGNGSGGFVVLV